MGRADIKSASVFTFQRRHWHHEASCPPLAYLTRQESCRRRRVGRNRVQDYREGRVSLREMAGAESRNEYPKNV